MNNAVIVSAFAALALYIFETSATGDIFADAESYLDNWMTDTDEALSLPNVQAFLMLIRTGEGTANGNGYSTLFGGRLFDGFSDHPNITIKAGGYTSTAAGAYQFLYSTWRGLGLPDFSPANQDRGAVMLIKRRGALADVVYGRIGKAITKCNKEWASLPGSPYGQPTMSLSRAFETYARWGGSGEATA